MALAAGTIAILGQDQRGQGCTVQPAMLLCLEVSQAWAMHTQRARTTTGVGAHSRSVCLGMQE